MNFAGLFSKSESLIAVDVGSTSIKLVELNMTGDKPMLVNVATAPLDRDVYANNLLKEADFVAEKLNALLEANAVNDKRAAVAIPGPSVFTKKIKMAKVPPNELSTNVQFEAGSFIPHSIDAVKLDFHVVGESGKNQLDILVVAAKSEVIESFTDCLALAGVDTAVVDVDYFALQNCFEMGYPEHFEKTIALVNMGARYSSINICSKGESLFTGDVSIGGKVFTDAIMQEIQCDVATAESLKKDYSSSEHAQAIEDILERKVEYVATEFNRQLSLFWNATGATGGVDMICLTGGGALVKGLLEELKEKTGIECMYIDALQAVTLGDGFDASYVKGIASQLAIAIGLGMRYPGDKELPNY